MIERRFSVNLTPRAARALGQHVQKEEMSNSAVINRALVFYAAVMEKMEQENTEEITIGSKTIGVFL